MCQVVYKALYRCSFSFSPYNHPTVTWRWCSSLAAEFSKAQGVSTAPRTDVTQPAQSRAGA